MRLYYYTSDLHGISAIKNQRIKISRFKDLNDPFEMEALLSTADGEISGDLAQYKDYLARTFGLICLSRTSTEMLMWSHYAKNHTGIVLGFDAEAVSAKDWETTDKDKINLLKHPLQVTYSDSRIVRENKFENADNALISALLLTKSKSWSYENEYRVLTPLITQTDSLWQSDDGKLIFLKFKEHLVLREVLLGPRCIFKPFKIKEILSEAGFTGVKVSEMVLASKTFEIVRRK